MYSPLPEKGCHNRDSQSTCLSRTGSSRSVVFLIVVFPVLAVLLILAILLLILAVALLILVLILVLIPVLILVLILVLIILIVLHDFASPFVILRLRKEVCTAAVSFIRVFSN